MKKLLALACAASVLALASGANAQITSYDVKLTGTVVPACNITTADGVTATLGGNVARDWLHLTDANGHITGNGDNVAFIVAATAKCDYSLVSANAGLKSATTSATIPYNASVTATAAAIPTVPVVLNPLISSTLTGVDLRSQTVYVNYATTTDATTIYPAGTDYKDTLTISVAAHV